MYSFEQLLEHYQYLQMKKAEIVDFLAMPQITDETKMSYIRDLEKYELEIQTLEKSIMDTNYKIKKHII